MDRIQGAERFIVHLDSRGMELWDVSNFNIRDEVQKPNYGPSREILIIIFLSIKHYMNQNII